MYSKITAVLIGSFKLKDRHNPETSFKKLNNSLLKWTQTEGASVFGPTEFYLDIYAGSRKIELWAEGSSSPYRRAFDFLRKKVYYKL